MKRMMAVLTGLSVALGVGVLAGAEEGAAGKPKSSAKGKGRAAVAKKDPPAAKNTGETASEDDLSATLDGEADGTRPSLRVLENPYDIASFYRSDAGQGGLFAMDAPGTGASDRYPIAGFYRAEGGQGPYAIAGFYRAGGGAGHPLAGLYRGGQGAYGGFWNSGYGAHRRGRVLVGYRRSIGENGDIFLVAPFLAPVGPLSGAFTR